MQRERAALAVVGVVVVASVAYGAASYVQHDRDQPHQAGTPSTAHDDPRRPVRGNMPSTAENPPGTRADVGVCEDARRVGAAVRVTAEGATIASLEQFYSPSCDETYAHLEMEQSYRASANRYNVTLGVFLPPPDYPPSAENGDAMYGTDWERATQREFWFKHASKNHCAKVDASVQTAYGEPIHDADTAAPKGCHV